MKTLNISISEIEFNKFGLTQNNLNFTDFIALVSKELMRQNLNKCIELSSKYGLSNITMDEISIEVNKVRNDKSNN